MDNVKFTINGVESEVPVSYPTQTLLEYLHTQPNLQYGTKFGCGEGGCGACTVVVDEGPHGKGKVKTINSCLRPLAACGGLKVTTVENLPHNCTLPQPVPSLLKSLDIGCDKSLDKPPESCNDIAYKIAKNCGTQCGYCTVGFAMTLHAANENKVTDIEDLFGGHVCRCTGYRGLQVTAKEMLNEREHLDENTMMKDLPPNVVNFYDASYSNKQLQHDNVELSYVNPGEDQIPHFYPTATPTPDSNSNLVEDANLSQFQSHAFFLQVGSPAAEESNDVPESDVDINDDSNTIWKHPKSIQAAKNIITRAQVLKKPFKLVYGNTSAGIFKDCEWTQVELFVDMNRIQVQNMSIEESGDDLHFRIPTGTTLTDLRQHIEDNMRGENGYEETNAVLCMLRRVAGTQVRNAGTVCGSVAMAIHWNFLSDTFLGLATSGGVINFTRLGDDGHWVDGSLSLFDAVHQLRCDKQHHKTPFIIKDIVISLHKSHDRFIRCFKVARRMQNSHSLVNFGCSIMLGSQKTVIAVGNIADGYLQLIQTANALGKYIAQRHISDIGEVEVLNTCRNELHHAVTANSEGDSKEERIELALNLLKRFIASFFSHQDYNTYDHRVQEMTHNSHYSHHYRVNPIEAPTSEPMIKLTAIEQGMGITPYARTMEVPANCLQATFLLTIRSTGRLEWREDVIEKLFEFNDDRTSPLQANILAKFGPAITDACVDKMYFYRAKDIAASPPTSASPFDPTVNPNYIESWAGSTFCEYLVAPFEVVYSGQAIAIIVTPFQAVTEYVAVLLESHFETESELNVVNYKDTYLPILSVLDERKTVDIAYSSVDANPVSRCFLKDEVIVDRTQVPFDFELYKSKPEEFVVVDGEHEVGGQNHFYLETQSAFAIPNGDKIEVTAASQSPFALQNFCTPFRQSYSSVEVLITNLGGGFGGKTECQGKYVPLATTFVAGKLKVPCRMVLDRDRDMRMTGGRHPYYGKYTLAGEISTGKIVAVKVDLIADGGINYDCSTVVLDVARHNCFHSYNIPNYRCTGQVMFTNKASSTAFRSFGVIQSNNITEEAMDLVCRELIRKNPQLTPHGIRFANFYSWHKNTPNVPASEQETTAYGQFVPSCNLQGIWRSLSSRIAERYLVTTEGISNAEARERAVEMTLQKPSVGFEMMENQVRDFNSRHTHLKQGYTVIPLMYGIAFNTVGNTFDTMESNISICPKSFHLLVYTSCVEMGQGTVTKLVQIAASVFGVPLDMVELKYERNTVNSIGTGSSTTSDLHGSAIKEHTKVEGENQSQMESEANRLKHFLTVAQLALGENFLHFFEPSFGNSHFMRLIRSSDWIDVAQRILNFMKQKSIPSETAVPVFTSLFKQDKVTLLPDENGHGQPYYYFNYAACVSKVQLDCHTGEWNLLNSDSIYDAGLSINPAIDIGQIEGGFMQGVGYVTIEETKYFESEVNRGKLMTDSTWTYKVPTTTEIPIDWNTYLYPCDEGDLKLVVMPEDDPTIVTSEETSRFKRVVEEVTRDKYKHWDGLKEHWRGILKHRRGEKKESKNNLSSTNTVSEQDLVDSFGILSSKTTGEPPLVLGNSVYFAIKDAIGRFKASKPNHSNNNEQYVDVHLKCPATTFNIVNALV